MNGLIHFNQKPIMGGFSWLIAQYIYPTIIYLWIKYIKKYINNIKYSKFS